MHPQSAKAASDGSGSGKTAIITGKAKNIVQCGPLTGKKLLCSSLYNSERFINK